MLQIFEADLLASNVTASKISAHEGWVCTSSHMISSSPPLPPTNPAATVMSPSTMKRRDKCYFPSKNITQIHIWIKKLGM